MIVRSSHIITLPSGNLARDFRWESLGYGRVRVQYNYTDRRRNHQVARKFTVEFLNGKVENIQARSANGGRVEFFKSSTIINELLEMLAEFNEVVNGVAARNEPAKVETVEQDVDTVDKFREYFDFEDYWHNNGGETITTSYGVYMVDTKGLAYWLKELAAY